VKIGREMGVLRVDRRGSPMSYSIAPIGVDPKTSAINRYLQSWDVPNVFATGTCVYRQSAGRNPMGPVGALAF